MMTICKKDNSIYCCPFHSDICDSCNVAHGVDIEHIPPNEDFDVMIDEMFES